MAEKSVTASITLSVLGVAEEARGTFEFTFDTEKQNKFELLIGFIEAVTKGSQEAFSEVGPLLNAATGEEIF